MASPEGHIISDEQRTLIEHLLRERISLRGDLLGRGRQSPVAVALYGGTLCGVSRTPVCSVTKGPAHVVIHQLEAEADEMWSLVGKKANRQWIWIAMDATTGQIIAFHVGDRSREGARDRVVLNRLCCDLREIVMADEIFDGAHMIDQLFGE